MSARQARTAELRHARHWQIVFSRKAAAHARMITEYIRPIMRRHEGRDPVEEDVFM